MSASRPDEHPLMVADCVGRESKLTEWEREFVDSVERQIELGRFLSEKQAEVLDRIWDRVTA